MVGLRDELREEIFILGAGFSRAISDNMPLTYGVDGFIKAHLDGARELPQ